jgi:hypothetical protein
MKAPAAFRAALAAVLAFGLAAPLTEAERAYYRADPVAYARDRLGVVLMLHQCALAYAAAGQWHRITPEMAELSGMRNPGMRKIAVRSAVKTGKSTLLVVLALWYYECCRDETHGAKFLLTAAKGDQIRTVIWSELRRILRTAPHAPEGKASRDPAKGFKSADESCVILGFTGRNAEAMAGQSGNLALAVDEASALEKEKADAIAGNRAGGGDLGAFQIWFANPTRSSGPLYDAFHSQKEFYTTFHFDGVPISEWNERQAKPTKFVITSQAIRESAAENGKHDPFHVVRMRGNFIEGEVGKIVPMVVIAAMQERWRELWLDDDGRLLTGRALEEKRALLFRTTRLGPLRIGYDPASEKLNRDEHGFAAVRGNVALDVYTRRGMKKEEALAELWALIARYRAEGETPDLSVDVEGEIGNEFRIAIAAEAEERRIRRPADAFTFHAVRSSSKHVRDRNYVRVRDELWKTLGAWALEGAIPMQPRLETEIYAHSWIPIITAQGQQTVATPKSTVRDTIHRSSDLADALCLAIFRADTSGTEIVRQQVGEARREPEDLVDANAAFYQGEDASSEPTSSGDGDDPFSWAR